MTESNLQALVIQKVNNPIHCINLNPLDNAVGIHNTYRLDNDLSGLLRYKIFEAGPDIFMDKRTSLTVKFGLHK